MSNENGFLRVQGCAHALAQAMRVFIGGAILPMRPLVNVRELCVSRVLEDATFPAANLKESKILPGPQKL